MASGEVFERMDTVLEKLGVRSDSAGRVLPGSRTWADPMELLRLLSRPAVRAAGCRGRFPLVLHLLAPDQRAVQVTTDRLLGAAPAPRPPAQAFRAALRWAAPGPFQALGRYPGGRAAKTLILLSFGPPLDAGKPDTVFEILMGGSRRHKLNGQEGGQEWRAEAGYGTLQAREGGPSWCLY